MAKHKGDIEIGERLYKELIRIFGSSTKARKALRCEKSTMSEWKNGRTPGGFWLARFHYIGGDVIYVLTGRRHING